MLQSWLMQVTQSYKVVLPQHASDHQEDHVEYPVKLHLQRISRNEARMVERSILSFATLTGRVSQTQRGVP